MKTPLPVTAVVPAAGLSRRFGGPNKLLQPWGETTIVGAVVQTLIHAALPVIVVTGRDSETVAAACPGARSIFNPNFQAGLGASIAQGARHAPTGHGVLIALGDMPDLEVDTVRSLTSRYLDPLTILAIAYEDDPGRPAHPVLFGSAYRDELADLEGDEGARRILQSHRSHLQLVSMGGHLADIDQPTDAIKERDATGGGAPQSRRLRAPPENDHD